MKYTGKVENTVKKYYTFLSAQWVKKGLFLFTVSTTFLAIYLLNRLHPLFGDDWMYSVSKTGRITSFTEILREQYIHYFEWGGRTVVHIIAQTLLLSGIEAGDLLNSLAYIIFVFIIYFIANRKQKINLTLFIGINMMIWFFTRDFGTTLLWITGSANYLWGTMLIFLFLIMYINYLYNEKNINDGYPVAILFLIWGIITGWTNENTSIALIFLLISFLIYFKKKKNFIPKWSVSGCIGTIIGCIFMLAAPGNKVRSEYLQEFENKTAGIYSFEALFNGFIKAVFGFYDYTLPLAFIFILGLILFRIFGLEENKKKIYLLVTLLFSACVIGTLAMAGSPVYPARASFGLNSFLILATAMMYSNMDFRKKEISWIGKVTILYAIAVFAMDYYSAYQDLSMNQIIINERIEKVEKEKKNGNKDINIEGICIHSHSRFLHFWELSGNPDSSHNYWFSRFYGINSVKMICTN